jgi:hypothetical protein
VKRVLGHYMRPRFGIHIQWPSQRPVYTNGLKNWMSHLYTEK